MLEMLSEKIANCQKCPELVDYRIKTVPGEGNPNARVVFCGEAPGESESESGRPFVGKAGQLLDNIIKAIGFNRSDVFICNILKCRPPRNRTPLPQECQNCRPFLDLQLKIINPKYIVCLGNVAAQNLMGITTPITYLRGEVMRYNEAKVVFTYHPSYLLQNPGDKWKVWQDMQLLLSLMAKDN